jgi:hypothetical protein
MSGAISSQQVVNVSGGGGGGGLALMSTATVNVTSSSVSGSRKTKAKRGRGSGSGVGYGTGSGSGNGNGDGYGTAVQPPPKAPKTPAEIRDDLLKSKLHTWLYSLVARLERKDAKVSENEPLFVRDGKAELQIELTAVTDSIREKLKAAGLEITGEKGARVSGRIEASKLAALADIEEVKYVLPRIGAKPGN